MKTSRARRPPSNLSAWYDIFSQFLHNFFSSHLVIQASPINIVLSFCFSKPNIRHFKFCHEIWKNVQGATDGNKQRRVDQMDWWGWQISIRSDGVCNWTTSGGRTEKTWVRRLYCLSQISKANFWKTCAKWRIFKLFADIQTQSGSHWDVFRFNSQKKRL